MKTIQLRPPEYNKPAVTLVVPKGWHQVKRGKTRKGDLWFIWSCARWIHATPGLPVNGTTIRRDGE